MAKKSNVPAEPAEDPTAIAAPKADAPITGFVEKRAFAPVSTPKVSPRYAFECVVGLGKDDYVYKLHGVDGADCKAQLVKDQPAFAANLSKIRFNAKRQSWTPVNVESLTVEQVGKLNGLTEAQKAELAPKAIQPETEVEALVEQTEAA